MNNREYQLGGKFNELLLALFKGITDEPRWRGFLVRLGDALGATHVTLTLRAPSSDDTGVVISCKADGSDSGLGQPGAALDPFVDLPPGEVYTIDEFMDREALEKQLHRQPVQRVEPGEHVLEPEAMPTMEELVEQPWREPSAAGSHSESWWSSSGRRTTREAYDAGEVPTRPRGDALGGVLGGRQPQRELGGAALAEGQRTRRAALGRSQQRTSTRYT